MGEVHRTAARQCYPQQMSAFPSRSRPDVPGIVAYGVVTAVALLYVVHRTHANLGGLELFWDARVYARALADWRHGVDPYRAAAPARTGIVLPFVSPPVFLYLMGALSHVFPGRLGAVLYCSLASLCTLAVPALLARIYLRSHWMTAALCLFLAWFQPGKYGSQALLTGNLSNLLYAALLVAGAPGVRRNRWLPFFCVLLFAGLMKPTFLPFLVLPLLAGNGQWRPSLAVVLAVLAGNLAQWAAMPTFWREFQQNVVTRVFVHGDAGFGLLGQFTRLNAGLNAQLPWLHPPSPSVEALCVLVPLAALLLRLRVRQPNPRLWVPCLVVFAVLANPRTLDYDVYVAVIPAVYLVVECLQGRPPNRWRALSLGVALTLFASLLSSAPETAICLLLVISVLLVAVQRFFPARFGSTPAPDAQQA